MRLERISSSKIKIFVTFDELAERGLTKDDIGNDSLKWQQLFFDMLKEASDEWGIAIGGTILVDIFSLQAQGMILMLTLTEHDESFTDESDDLYLEMNVISSNQNDVFFKFLCIEHVIQLSERVFPTIIGGKLYSYNDHYYLYLRIEDEQDVAPLISLLSEYGEPTLNTIHYIEEYGKVIINEHAIDHLYKYFSRK